MLNVTKAFCTNENQKFPSCHICKNELSPFFISDKELLTLSKETLNQLSLAKLLIKYNNRNIIYLCKTCISYEKS